MITINARGARTLADARPLQYAGTGVYVTISENEAALHLGGRVVAVRNPAEIATILDAQDWAYEIIETATEVAGEVRAFGAQQVRESATEALAEADRQDAIADDMASRKTTCADPRNPRHPANRAKAVRRWAESLRSDAVILAAWTPADEAGYSAYVSDGIGATDGYFAPEDRAAWKRHQTR